MSATDKDWHQQFRTAMCRHVDDGATVETTLRVDGQVYASRLCGKCRAPLTFTPAFAK